MLIKIIIYYYLRCWHNGNGFALCRFDKKPFQPPEEMPVKVEKRLGEFSERNVALTEILNNLKGTEIWLHHRLAYFVLNFVSEASMNDLTERKSIIYEYFK